MSVQFFVCEAPLLQYFDKGKKKSNFFKKLRRFGPRVLSVPSEDLPCFEKRKWKKGKSQKKTSKLRSFLVETKCSELKL